MKLTLETHFEQLAGHFTSGELHRIAAHFTFPTAVYYQDHMIVMNSAEEMVHAHGKYRQLLQGAGYTHTACDVIAQSLTRGDRKSVWVQWSHYREGGAMLGKSFIRFFVSHVQDQPMNIMLVEYLQLPSPAVADAILPKKKNSVAG
ncbi:hypothetical protein [uncultured Roseobacter sp.]|uniref:hypothetical protein n=1 Tax=uncultured Roseobacter sp. TaxID=114847 RepID=UPI00260E2230|nr:hypothetical protein [uncultured Roseobacter sp.]